MQLKAAARAELLNGITRRLEPKSFIRNPYLPDLLNQPDLLVSHEPGNLAALYLYDFGKTVSWHLTMGAVEDLFEFKISVGAQALATAVIAVPEIPNERQKQMLRLIENTFDDVHFLTGQPQTLAEEFYLRRVLFRREPKVNLIHLWKSEAEFQLDAARREIPPAELSSLVDKSRVPIDHNAGQAEERLYDVLTSSGRPVVPNPKIETIKPFVGKLKFPYRPNFDFMVNTQRPVLVELIRIARSNMRERLRYISLKARLTRYAWPRTASSRISPITGPSWLLTEMSLGQIMIRPVTSAPLCVLDGTWFLKIGRKKYSKLSPMKTFKRELKTILFTLSASRWAVQVGVQDVIVEYTHLQDAARTPTQARRVSLQIFHASRAIDSLLAHIAQYECIRAGRMPPTHWTLGSALMDIQNHRVNGSRFNPITKTEIDDITKSRNTYLHRANCFPTDRDIQQFLNKTIRAIQEATAFQP